MKLSVVIPAFNEEKRIGTCIRSVRAALSANARPDLETEIVVADNNSSDATPQIASREAARVVFEPVNQISRARNTGARAATGDWFLFLDADCELDAASVSDMLERIDEGVCAGGGNVIALDEAPWPGRLLIAVWNRISVVFTMLAGCFVFCRADAFRDIGGFSLDLFTTEELKFGTDLKRWARARRLRVVILRKRPVVTSGRKFYLYSKREWGRIFCRFLTSPRQAIREPQTYIMTGEGSPFLRITKKLRAVRALNRHTHGGPPATRARPHFATGEARYSSSIRTSGQWRLHGRLIPSFVLLQAQKGVLLHG